MADPTPALTDAERRETPALTDAEQASIFDVFPFPTTPSERRLVAARVARIKADAVAAALAPVERLADEWERGIAAGKPFPAHLRVDALRAALAEGKGGERQPACRACREAVPAELAPCLCPEPVGHDVGREADRG